MKEIEKTLEAEFRMRMHYLDKAIKELEQATEKIKDVKSIRTETLKSVLGEEEGYDEYEYGSNAEGWNKHRDFVRSKAKELYNIEL